MTASPADRGAAELEGAIGRMILGGSDRRSEQLEIAEHLALVGRAAEAERVSRDFLHRSVTAARGAGVSWAAIGGELGLTRQAVQQKFGSSAADDPASSEERWLGPVTAFDEMPELELAGRLGWRTVEAGMLRHRMLRTSTQWEHRRILWTRPVARYLADDWQVGCRAFPWLYLVRDLEIPPERELGES